MTLQRQLENYALWLEARGLKQVSRFYELDMPSTSDQSLEVVQASNLFVIEFSASAAEEDLVHKIISALKLENDFSLLRATKKDITKIPGLVKSWKLETRVFIFSQSLSEVSTGKQFSEVSNIFSTLNAIGLELFTTCAPKDLIEDPTKKAPLWQALKSIL